MDPYGQRSNRLPASSEQKINFSTGTIAVLAGVLILGVGIGSAITSTTDGGQGNIASQQQLDMAVPDPEFCRQWGASAFVIDVEMYTTLNPSTSFVTQPALQPGCVIRRENWTVLQKQGAISNEDVRECKQRMNTFAYIGSIRDKPIVKCVYQTDVNENKFIIKGDGQAEDGIRDEDLSRGLGDVYKRQQLDMAVPDPEFCRQWGASAFVIDVEMYTTLNPSTSFVTQPALQPGCVIRRENWTVLQKQGAISNEDVRECKQRMNTFAYIGSIRDKPIVKCVYQTDVNENKFIIKGDGQAEDGVGINKEAIQF